MGNDELSPDDAARYANDRLAEIIKDWPEVYGKATPSGAIIYHSYSRIQKDDDTHKARLAFIEEIKPVVCEHPPSRRIYIEDNIVRCEKCGKKLKAEWKEVE